MAKPPIILPIGEWLPDMPDLGNPGSSNVLNVYPRTPKSYGPVGSPVPYSNALTKMCQGAAAFLDTNGNVHLFAGDANDLYLLTAGSTDWTKVSKTADGYNCPPDQQWSFTYYNGKVVATDYADNIQMFDMAVGGAFADLAAAAPRAKYMAFIRNFLVVANTYDATDGVQPQRVWWPALGDPTNWPTPGSAAAAQVQSSYNDLFGDAGFIKGIVGNLGNADGAVFMEHGVKRMVYAGPPDVFDFSDAEGIRGTPAENSLVQYGNEVYYLGEDGFYVFDGLGSRPIGANKFDKTFFDDVDQNYLSRVIGTVDPFNKLIIWAYPGAGSISGVPNRLLLYNWQLERAAPVELTVEVIARLMGIGYTLDQLHTVLGYTLDDLPFPLDSSVWKGGQLILGLFDTNHKLNYLSGSSLAATVDTSEMQPFKGQRSLVTNTRPLVDGGVPSVALGRRERQQDAVKFTSSSALNALGNCPLFTSGRYMRARITTPAGASFSHIQGVELEAGPSGSR